MSKVIAHKQLRNTTLGVVCKSFKVDKFGVLAPQPAGDDLKQIQKIRFFHMIDDPKSPGLNPPTSPVAVAAATEVAPPAEDARVQRISATLSILEEIEEFTPVNMSELPPNPEEAPAPLIDSFTKAELLEIAKERGIPGLQNKTKAEIYSIVMGE